MTRRSLANVGLRAIPLGLSLLAVGCGDSSTPDSSSSSTSSTTIGGFGARGTTGSRTTGSSGSDGTTSGTTSGTGSSGATSGTGTSGSTTASSSTTGSDSTGSTGSDVGTSGSTTASSTTSTSTSSSTSSTASSTTASSTGGTSTTGTIGSTTGSSTTSSSTTGSSGSRLYFSELLEGIASNKVVELFNPSGQSVVLAGHRIEGFANGGALSDGGPTSTFTFLNDAGAIGANATFTICNNQLDAGGTPVRCDLVANGPTSFNGDDSFQLVAPDGTVLDTFGDRTDPGAGWGPFDTATGLLWSVDHGLRRKCSVTTGLSRFTTAPFDCSTEWEVYGPNDFSGIGQRSCP